MKQRAKYLTGIINDPAVIYAVNGGMEDWAYGASWLATGKVDCNPSTFGGTYRGLWVCVSLCVCLDVLTAGLCGPLCFCALVLRIEW